MQKKVKEKAFHSFCFPEKKKSQLALLIFETWSGYQVGLYKVEFRILEIQISGETNLKKHFLSGNWIRKKFFGRKKRLNFGSRPKIHSDFWRRLFFFFFWRSPNFGRKNCLNFGFRPIIHSEFWQRPFFFFFWRSPNFGRKKLYCHNLPWVILE